MIYCKRCSLRYIRGEVPLEEVAEAKVWTSAYDNERWMVCKECEKVLNFCNFAMTLKELSSKDILDLRKKKYEETKEGTE